MELLHATARTSVQWMFYSLVEGTILALLAWILLRLLPRQNSRTRFALWFSVLLAIIVLPFLAHTFFRAAANRDSSMAVASSRSLMTFPDSVAFGIFILWAFIAALGMLRVIAGMWQVNRIRKHSEEVDPRSLDAVVRTSMESFPRPVSLRVSDQVQMPAAFGFFKLAVIIPRWFLQEISPAELHQVLLHELTHLRRRDDWTNLAQKIIKALLFFHPSVWWLEWRLALEREMACDEAVLAQSASAHGYAQCLTRLAERTLTKRKLALAQGIVSRMQQLSLRVAQILDANRPSSPRLWKPAVPMVVAAAALCGLSAWNAPVLVSFQDKVSAVSHFEPASAFAREVKVDARSPAAQPKLVLAGASLNQPSSNPPSMRHSMIAKKTAHKQPRPAPGDYVIHSEQFIVTVAGDSSTGRTLIWQVCMWQVRIPASTGDHAGKTIPRKTI